MKKHTPRALRILMSAVSRYARHGHKTDAAALTYTTLFALVPLLTVVYSALSILPSLQATGGDIESLLMGSLMPASGDAIMGYLHQFSQQARQLTAVGVVFLIITAFMMLRTIEMTFNKIWQLDKNRKGLSSFLLYWAILSLGPFMLSFGLAFSSYVTSLELWREDWVPGVGLQIIAILIPFASSFLAFTLIYWAVPNCRVPLPHAAVGGAVVAICFEVGKALFAEATTMFPSYQLIYGAFAAVPLFLLWLYLSWSLILLGAELVYQASNPQLKEGEQQETETDYLAAELELLALLYFKHREGQPAYLNELAEQAELMPGFAQAVLKRLEAKQLIALKGGPEQDSYFLIRDLYHFSLADVLSTYPLTVWEKIQPDGVKHLQQETLQQLINNESQHFSAEFRQPLTELFHPSPDHSSKNTSNHNHAEIQHNG